jgi:hypothetical protein
MSEDLPEYNAGDALIPVEEKTVLFYEDELTAVLVEKEGRAEIYVPLRPIAEQLGLNWSGQYLRIRRDPILSESTRGVFVTQTPGRGGGTQEMMALPLKFIPGWLFGVNVNRVREDLREKILRYQRECYDVLAEAFQEGRLTADEEFAELLKRADPDVVQAYQMARAIVRLARNQLLLEARLAGRLDDHEDRLEDIEERIGIAGTVTEEQAAHISQAVKAIAYKLSERSGRNEYGGVYSQLYSRFGITGYKLLPARRFGDAMEFLSEWWRDVAGVEPPF